MSSRHPAAVRLGDAARVALDRLRLLPEEARPLDEPLDGAGGAAASAAGVGNAANSSGVTWFTILSVHCADRMVATSSCQGDLWSSSQSASG